MQVKHLLFILILIILSSCHTTTEVIAAKKALKGEWRLQTITYDRTGTFEVTLFNDATVECMEGSTWKFIPNNYSGKYIVNEGACLSTGARNFLWTIPQADANGMYSFMLKPVDKKKKSMDNRGFRMNLSYLDVEKMTWTQQVMLEGDPFVITMNFDKITTTQQ